MSLTSTALLRSLTCVLVCLVAPASLKAQTLTVSSTPINTTPFIGLGVEFDPFTKPPSPAHWHTMMERLAFMHPGFLRVMSGAGDYTSGLDVAGNPIYRWKTDPNDIHLQHMYDVLNFAQVHNIPVYLGEWFAPTGFGIQPADPRWARMIADFVKFLIRDRHYTVVQHYIMMNEPHGEWMWPKPNFAIWSTGIRQLRSELDARNLQQVTLAGPDADPHWIALSTKNLPSLFTSWEEHIYAQDEELLSGKLESDLVATGKVILSNDPHGADKPRFLGEAGIVTGKLTAYDQQPRVHDFDYGVLMADFAVQVARAGWSGLSAWDLDDAMHPGPKGGLKIWGFWNSTTDEGMALRPWFYTWSTLSRTLPAGAQILSVQGPVTPVRATAASWHSTRSNATEYTVVLVNERDSPVTIALDLPVKNSWHTLRYFSEDRRTTPAGFPATSVTTQPTRRQNLTFPGRGVIVLTTEWPTP